MLNALRSRENFLRENRLPESDDPDCQFDSDSDLVDFGLEFRVKKLVQDFHEREKANIRRCKSMNSKIKPRLVLLKLIITLYEIKVKAWFLFNNLISYLRCQSLKRRPKIESLPSEAFFEAGNHSQEEFVNSSGSSTSAELSHPLADNSLSSLTEFSASYIDNSNPESNVEIFSGTFFIILSVSKCSNFDIKVCFGDWGSQDRTQTFHLTIQLILFTDFRKPGLFDFALDRSRLDYVGVKGGEGYVKIFL